MLPKKLYFISHVLSSTLFVLIILSILELLFFVLYNVLKLSNVLILLQSNLLDSFSINFVSFISFVSFVSN